MVVEEHVGMVLDCCRSCQGVWFDHGELQTIWSRSFDKSLQRNQHKDSNWGAVDLGAEAVDALFHALFLLPQGTQVASDGSQSMVAVVSEVLSELPAGVAASAEVVAEVLGSAAEATASVLGAMAEILGDIF